MPEIFWNPFHSETETVISANNYLCNHLIKVTSELVANTHEWIKRIKLVRIFSYDLLTPRWWVCFSGGIKGGPFLIIICFWMIRIIQIHTKSAPHYIVTFSREIRMGSDVVEWISQIVLSTCRPIHAAATQSIAEQCTSDGLPWVGNGDKLTSVFPWKDLCSFRQKFSFRFPFIAEQWVSNPQHHHKPSVSHRCQCFLWQFRGEEPHGFHITGGKGGVCFSHHHQTVSKHT